METCITSEPCTFCQGESSLALEIRDPQESVDGRVYICNDCYYIGCRGSDQQVAQLWKGLLEATSKGYSDAGFLHGTSKLLAAKKGYLAGGWYTWTKHINNNQIPVEGFFLLAALPNPTMPAMPHIWCRSRLPAFHALTASAQKLLPIFELPGDILWDSEHGRFFVGKINEAGTGIDTEKNPAVLAALMALRIRSYGDRDFFTLLANEGTPYGFEIIRRMIL